MKYTKKYKQDILDKLSFEDSYNQIAKRIDFKPQNNTNIMKKGLKIASGVLCLSIIVGVGAYFAITNSQTKVLSAKSFVKMDLNPSITLVVDENNKVVSVNGENNEGQMIVVDENIEGKTLEEAIEIILTIENQTGYLVSGNATIDDNKVSISVSVDDEKIKDNMEKRISETVNRVYDELNVNGTLTYVETSIKDLKEELIKYNAYAQEKIDSMNFEQVYEELKINYQEAAVMYSQEIIDLYNQAKIYEFKIAESDFTVKMIKDLGGIQAALLEGVFKAYEFSMDALKSGIDALNDARYNHFIKEDSLYQQANDELLLYKSEVIKFKNELAVNENLKEEQKAAIQSKLDAQLSLLNNVSASLSSLKVNAETVLIELENAINTLMNKVTEIKDEIVSLLSIDVEKELSNKAVELDAYLNTTKSEFFNNFETKYAEEIEASKQKLIEYKQSLIDNKQSLK